MDDLIARAEIFIGLNAQLRPGDAASDSLIRALAAALREARDAAKTLENEAERRSRRYERCAVERDEWREAYENQRGIIEGELQPRVERLRGLLGRAQECMANAENRFDVEVHDKTWAQTYAGIEAELGGSSQ